MEMEATLAPATASPAAPSLKRVAALLWRVALQAVIVLLLVGAWHVRQHTPYTSGSDFGYWLGVTGGSMMLVLLIYPLRKRIRWLGFLGPLKHWFRFHLLAGILGPLIVLFHSTFHVGSFNALVALTCMLLVVSSGIVGRFIYRRIHHGLYGSRATLGELRSNLQQQIETLRPQLEYLPLVRDAIERYAALVSTQPVTRLGRAVHFLSLGWRRLLAGYRIHRAIARYNFRRGKVGGLSKDHLQNLVITIDETLRAVQRTAQFSTYERLFSLWHVVHIPFLCMLVITAIAHVVAVHAY